MHTVQLALLCLRKFCWLEVFILPYGKNRCVYVCKLPNKSQLFSDVVQKRRVALCVCVDEDSRQEELKYGIIYSFDKILKSNLSNESTVS